MNNWEILEEKAYYYLKDNFEDKYSIKTEYIGSSNSFEKDINIYKNDMLLFSMDVKAQNAQSSQFVVTFDEKTNRFSFGKNNRSIENLYSQKIIQELNTNKQYIKWANSDVKRRIPLDIRDEISLGWIKSSYIEKNVKYLFTVFNDEPVIIHIDNLEKYFDVQCNLRPKASGSHPVSNVNIPVIHKALSEEYPEENITKSQFFKQDKHLHINYNKSLFPDKVKKYSYDNGEKYLRYQLKKVKPQLYEVRQLSNTFNPTVIFQIQCTSPQRREDIERFINDIK